MSIIKSARQQIEREKNADVIRTHVFGASKSKGPVYEDGELMWIGEYADTRETRPHKLVRGDKQPMTPQEQRLFVRTVYERGFTEYHYEGSIRLKDSGGGGDSLRTYSTLGSGGAAAPAGGSASSAQGGGGGDRYTDPKDPRRGLREGSGTLKYPKGEIYEGEWKNGRREGQGTLRTPQHYRYVGRWDEDMMAGQGVEFSPSGCSFNGAFENGVPSGNGNFYFTTNTNTQEQYHYEGPFVNGLRHGEGTIFYPNGDTFKGTWVNGKRHGRGITIKNVGGRSVQYLTEWEENVMKGEPRVLDRMKRTKPPRTTATLTSQDAVMPADLTKWTVKDDVEDLSLEHFLRIKLGFEKLDEDCSGSLSIGELVTIWGKSSQAMLRKLDTDSNGTIELHEIFAAWYPRVPSYSITRFLVQDVHPRTLLRLRGILGLKIHDHKQGYLQMVGIDTVEQVEDRPLHQRQLEANSYRIGGEKFSLAMYESAKNLCDPPHFSEIMEVSYPNIPRSTLLRYEMTEISPEELEDLREDFFEFSKGEPFIRLERFFEAQAKWQQRTSAKVAAARDGQPAPDFEDDEADPDRLENHAVEGFFKWQPFWPIGNINRNPIFLSTPLLKDIDAFGTKVEEMVTLPQIIRFCYPNVPCRRTAEFLSGKRRNANVRCECCICVNFDPDNQL